MHEIYDALGEAEEDRLASLSRQRHFDVEVSGGNGFALESAAGSREARILIGQELLQLTLQKGELALRFLLAHELGHHVTPEAATIVEQEEQADDFALRNLRGFAQSPRHEPDAATLAQFAQAFDDLAGDLEQQLARLERSAERSNADETKANLCELAVELHWRASFVREKAVLGRFYTTQEIRRQSAAIINEVRSFRRALLGRAEKCEHYWATAATADTEDAQAAALLVRLRLGAVRARLQQSTVKKTVLPTDESLNARRSEWRDDATMLSFVRAGPWLGFKSYGVLAGWAVGASFAPPFLTLFESRDRSGYPLALMLSVDYARAAATVDAQDTAVPDRVLQVLRFGVGGVGDASRRRSRFYQRLRVGFGPAYNVVTKTDGSTRRTWAGFVEGNFGAGYKLLERLRVGGTVGAALQLDDFIHASQGELSACLDLSWYVR